MESAIHSSDGPGKAGDKEKPMKEKPQHEKPGAEKRRKEKPLPQNTEQAIMDAAEELFLDKGYKAATTTMIARKAGVTHAMLHYYFRTKEHIFMKVLEKTLAELVQSFRPVMNRDEPFRETLEKGIATHFDFLSRHPRLVPFLYDTVLHSPELVERVKEKFFPTVQEILSFHISMIRKEMDKGTIRSTDPNQILLDIATLNISTFLMLPVTERFAGSATLKEMLDGRKNEIIELIGYRLYGETR